MSDSADERIDEQLRKIYESPTMRKLAAGYAEQINKIYDSPAMKALAELDEARLEQLLNSPVLDSLAEQAASVTDSMPDSVAATLADYQGELVRELVDGAARAEGAKEQGDADSLALWFGFETRRMLLYRMEGLLKTLTLLATITLGTGQVSDNELPVLVGALLLMFLATADLLLYLSKGPPDDD